MLFNEHPVPYIMEHVNTDIRGVQSGQRNAQNCEIQTKKAIQLSDKCLTYTSNNITDLVLTMTMTFS